MLPIYWLVNMSLRTNEDIMSRPGALAASSVAREIRLHLQRSDLGSRLSASRSTYVAINTVISVTVALPAAYAFNRYRFLGDKHLFFWLLYQPDGAGGGVRDAVLQSLLRDRPVRYALGGGAGALPVQRAAGGVDSRRLRRRRAARDRRDGGDRRLFVPALLHPDLPAADRQRHRRHGVLLLHVLLGRATAGDAR